MTVIRGTFVLFVFLYSSLGIATEPSPVPTCTPITVDCSECQAYQCTCATKPGEFLEIKVNQLPFQEQVPDPDLNNSTCGPEVSGPCRCDGSYQVLFTQLPLKDDRCRPQSPDGEKRLATVLNCQKQDSYCQPKCSKWVQKTCTICR